jgi:hypothetical protein
MKLAKGNASRCSLLATRERFFSMDIGLELKAKSYQAASFEQLHITIGKEIMTEVIPQ